MPDLHSSGVIRLISLLMTHQGRWLAAGRVPAGTGRTGTVTGSHWQVTVAGATGSAPWWAAPAEALTARVTGGRVNLFYIAKNKLNPARGMPHSAPPWL